MTPEPTPLPVMRHNQSGYALLYAVLFCDDKDFPEVNALVELCQSRGWRVGNA